jgi:hypothetical protein
MAVTMSRLSREYVWTRIQTPNDLSESVIEVAFKDSAAALPGESDWEPASKFPFTDATGSGWDVRVLVGPDHVSAIDLTPPSSAIVDYQQWVRITDNPERPVRRAGVVTVQ